jgi:predicted amidohydrolase YtcJ
MEPLGNLRESAEESLRNMRAAEPPPTKEEIKEALRETFRKLNEWGITSVQEPGAMIDKIPLYQELREEGTLTIRNTFLVWGGYMRTREGQMDTFEAIKILGLKPGFGDDMLKFAGLKLMTDGSMSAANCALYEPYVGQPDNIGIIHERVGTKEEFVRYVVEGHKAGLRLGIHAIGDRGIDFTLDGIEAALEAFPREDHRHSIEHCGLPTKEALERMKRLGVTAASSVGFGWELGDQHLSLIGPERMERYYPHKSFLEYGIKAGANFDYSVCMANVMEGIYVMHARRSETGQNLGQSQAISRIDAIKAFTIDCAYLEFEENIKGSIEPGKLADFVILDKDILTCPQKDIPHIKILATYLGGKPVYKRK